MSYRGNMTGVLAGVGVSAALLLSNAAMGASVNVTGAHNATIADLSGVLGTNSSGFVTFSSGTGNNRVSGRVEYANNVIGTTQRFGLTLTQFNFVSDGAFQRTVDVSIVQDFRIAGASSGTAFAAASVTGAVNFGRNNQLMQSTVQSQHEGTNLPLIGFNPNGVLSSQAQQSLLSRSTGNPVGVGVVGDIYRIAVTYRFTLNAAGQVVSVELPQSLGDVATLVLVPLPPAAWAGLAGLGMAAAVRIRRQRRVVAGE